MGPSHSEGFRRLFLKYLFLLLAIAIPAIVFLEMCLAAFLLRPFGMTQVSSEAGRLAQFGSEHAAQLVERDKRFMQDWERRVRAVPALEYLVLDPQGKPLAGNRQTFSPLPSPALLLQRLNQTILLKNDYYVNTVPLVSDTHVYGYLLLTYPASALPPQASISWAFILGLLLLEPPVVLFVVVLIFASRLGKKLNQPVEELMGAVEKIKQHDLDFTIHYDQPDVLGDLCRAVNDLRTALQSSLLREWDKEEQMRELVAALSHDLRTPVTVIQGHIEGLQRAQPAKRAERLERYLPVLETNAQRIGRLLEEILLISSLEQAEFSLQMQAVHLGDELRRKAQNYELAAAEQEIRFRYELYRVAESEEALLDFSQIERVLDNLFENALRFTPKGGEITLSCAWNVGVLSISLHDTGSGIDPQELPFIFDKYYTRSRRPKQGKKKTVGLGLYVCRVLIEKHGGQIMARNRPEGGCEVSFWLPLQ